MMLIGLRISYLRKLLTALGFLVSSLFLFAFDYQPELNMVIFQHAHDTGASNKHPSIIPSGTGANSCMLSMSTITSRHVFSVLCLLLTSSCV